MENNDTFTITGIVHNIGQEQSFAEGRFRKTEFVLLKTKQFNGKIYEDFISLECQNEGQYQLTGLNTGNKAEVVFVIQGREAKREDLKGRFYNTLKAIKVSVLEATTTGQRAQNTAVDSQQRAVSDFVGAENPSLRSQDGPDDLPFALFIPLALGFLMNCII